MDKNKMIGDEGESDNKIVIDKISIGEKDEIATESENRLNPSELVIIKEIADTSILIESDMGDCWVSLNVKGKENSISFNIGDEVIISQKSSNGK